MISYRNSIKLDEKAVDSIKSILKIFIKASTTKLVPLGLTIKMPVHSRTARKVTKRSTIEK